MTSQSSIPGKISAYLTGTALLLALYLTSRHNYLLFHSLVELFSVAIAGGIFMIAWNSRRFIENNYLIFIGITYLFIGIIDLLHALAYKNMGVFPGFGANLPTQLWIAARYLQSCSLLAAPLILNRQLNIRPVFFGFCSVVSLLILSIFAWGVFPDCYVDGVGLTLFKKGSEYVIVLLLSFSLFFMLRKRQAFHHDVVHLLTGSIVLLILTELTFTLYTDVYGISNMVGHLFKTAAYYLIYKAMIETGLSRPLDLLFRELQQSNDLLEQRVMERTAELDDTIALLQDEIIERELTEEELLKSSEALQNETAERLRTMEVLHEKEQMLIQQSRQAAMGEMINNIAHQWRQPLNTLSLTIQQTQLYYELGQFDKAFLDNNVKRSMDLIQHMSGTIDDFRNYFRPDKEKVKFKAHETVMITLSLMEGSLSNQRVEIDAKDDPIVYGYRNEFSQVLLNILINAKDALTEREVDDPRILITIGAEGDRAVVTVADNAGGIPEDIMDRIFDPYFTTKGPQAGTGVGLFMSKTIIEKNMGGRLVVRNTTAGAEFRIEV